MLLKASVEKVEGDIHLSLRAQKEDGTVTATGTPSSREKPDHVVLAKFLVAGSHAGALRHMPDRSINALALDAIEAVLADAGIGRDLLNAAYVGNASAA